MINSQLKPFLNDHKALLRQRFHTHLKDRWKAEGRETYLGNHKKKWENRQRVDETHISAIHLLGYTSPSSTHPCVEAWGRGLRRRGVRGGGHERGHLPPGGHGLVALTVWPQAGQGAWGLDGHGGHRGQRAEGVGGQTGVRPWGVLQFGAPPYPRLRVANAEGHHLNGFVAASEVHRSSGCRIIII